MFVIVSFKDAVHEMMYSSIHDISSGCPQDTIMAGEQPYDALATTSDGGAGASLESFSDLVEYNSGRSSMAFRYRLVSFVFMVSHVFCDPFVDGQLLTEGSLEVKATSTPGKTTITSLSFHIITYCTLVTPENVGIFAKPSLLDSSSAVQCNCAISVITDISVLYNTYYLE